MNGSAVRRLAVDVSLLAVLFAAVEASAATVILVAPPGPSAAMSEAIVRVRGELISEGFQVEVMEGLTTKNSHSSLEQLAEARKADAVVAVLGDERPDSVEVWVVDQVTEKTVVRRIPFKPQADHAPKTFAIHTLELLRASFLEIALGPGSRANDAHSIPPAVVHFVGSEPPVRHSERFAVELGAAAVIGFGDVGPAILPVVRLGWAISPSFIAQVALAGQGSRPTVARAGVGSAQVAEEFALLGARYRFVLGRHLRPSLFLAAGALHTRVEGQADSPYGGRDVALWSLLLDGGVGIGVLLAERFEVGFAAHVQIAEPYPTIRFDRSIVATSTRPSLLFTLTVGAWL